MKVIIIDDEKQAIASLEMELKAITPKIEVIGTANSVKTGIELLKKETPQILFLDIRMNDGLGFDILQKVDNFGEFRVIFTTAYDQYALDAFKHNAFDYLLKPIDLDDLQESINRIKAEATLNYSIPTKQLDQIVKLSNVISEDAKIALSTSDGIFLKHISKIIHIKSDGNYTKFVFENVKKSMLISRTLKDFDKILSQSGFIRIHYSHLINSKHLESYHTKDGNYVKMSNGDILPVSTRKKSVLIDFLKGGLKMLV